MKITIQIKFEDDTTPPLTITQIERTNPLSAATLGLSLDESKGLLVSLQKELVKSQLQHFIQNQQFCSRCGTEGRPKNITALVSRACLVELQCEYRV
jgi:hypothetical protein